MATNANSPKLKEQIQRNSANRFHSGLFLQRLLVLYNDGDFCRSKQLGARVSGTVRVTNLVQLTLNTQLSKTSVQSTPIFKYLFCLITSTNVIGFVVTVAKQEKQPGI